MKKTFQYTVYGLVSIFLMIACNKEITEDLLIFFKVEFSETNFEAFINTEEETKFSIVGVDDVSAGDYQIKYDVTEGAGSYFLNDVEIPGNQFIDLPNGPDFTLEFVGTAVGTSRVLITLRDQQEREEAFELTYNVNDTDFTFDVTPSSEMTFVTGEIDLNLSIEEISTATYEIGYTFVTPTDTDAAGTGTISVNGTALEPDTLRSISVGESLWKFEGLTVGTVDVEFTVTSSLGISKTELLSIAIGETPDFTFTATIVDSTNPTLTTNSGAAINFNITETVGMSSYVMNYSSSNTGNLVYSGDTFSPGDDIPVQVGESIGTYVGTVAGEHMIEFSVANANTVAISREASITLNYTDPDGTPPVIELVGDAEITINVGDVFNDPGATATDNIDGDITSQIQVTGTVNANLVGTYQLTYTVSDSAGNQDSAVRTVNVVSDDPPVITIVGDNPLEISFGATFTDPGATATDDIDGDITDQIQLTGSVDVNTIGSYTLVYSVTDSSNNTVEATRTVNVIDNTSPVIELVGSNPFNVNISTAFNDPGATATDNVDGDLTADITVSGSVDVDTPGDYVLTYSVTDSSNNTATTTRTVRVIDNIAPVITLNGASTITVQQGGSYTDPGATASDNVDGDITTSIQTTGNVDLNVPGTYTIEYNVQDAAGNNADEVVRTVIVESTDITPTWDLSTGLLTANPGDTVEITIGSGGNSGYTVQVEATADSPSGPTVGSLSAGTTNSSDSDLFIMPASGLVYFRGEHNGVSSGSSLTIIVEGVTIATENMGPGSPIPRN